MVRLTHVIAIDFEATYGGGEIIEFPAVLINLKTGEIEEEFHRYVRPDNNSLSFFMSGLTGIKQSDIDSGKILKDVLIDFKNWLKMILEKKSLKIPKLPKSLKFHKNDVDCGFVTWGNDLGVFLHNECIKKNIKIPNYFNYWINLQSIFMNKMKKKELTSLNKALNCYGVHFTGTQHFGLDDARNTAKLCFEMINKRVKMNLAKHV